MPLSKSGEPSSAEPVIIVSSDFTSSSAACASCENNCKENADTNKAKAKIVFFTCILSVDKQMNSYLFRQDISSLSKPSSKVRATALILSRPPFEVPSMFNGITGS